MTTRLDLQTIGRLVAEKSKVLDIGCSTGELLLWLKKNKSIDGRGMDISQADVSRCVQQGLTVIQGDADHDLKHYPDSGFDYVISSQMLQATKHPREVLIEMLRIGHHAIISIPNFGFWRNRFHLLIAGRMPVTKTLSYEWFETPNIHFCTIKDFSELCRDIGCTIKQVEYLDSADHPLSGLTARAPNLFAEKAIFLLGR